MPRITRDVAAIGVDIDPHGAQPPGQKVMGRGTPEEGGGLLRGGLELKNRFTATVRDPAVPFDIVVTVAAMDGWLGAEAVTLSRRPDGPAVNAEALRTTALSIYMQRIREELQRYLGGGLIMKEAGRSGNVVRYELPVADGDWDGFAEMRRAVRQARITPEIAAAAYQEALASPDPDQNRRPTAAVAERLGVSRGYISGLLSQARRKGIPGLGPTRAPRRGPQDRQPIVAAIVTSELGVLVGKRNDGKPPWTFVAGEVEPGEQPADAAVREVKEETGLEIEAGDIIGEREHPATRRHMIYMAGRPIRSLEVFVGDRAELAEVRWISLAEADELLPGMFGPVRQYLEYALGGTA